ncbi:MAG TPA: hypothetical protein VI854_05910, partial [Acidimicrobiia bacterium]|nr:hypothetical protein [Acidimicrobiia bacterium]
HHWHSTVRAGDPLHRHHFPFKAHGVLESLEDLPRIVPGEIRSGDLETWAKSLQAATTAYPELVPSDDVAGINEMRRRLGFAPLDHVDPWAGYPTNAPNGPEGE